MLSIIGEMRFMLPAGTGRTEEFRMTSVLTQRPARHAVAASRR
jgi:hypothetical protein